MNALEAAMSMTLVGIIISLTIICGPQMYANRAKARLKAQYSALNQSQELIKPRPIKKSYPGKAPAVF